MRALITGVGGFVGRQLAILLREHGHEVLGVHRSPLGRADGMNFESRLGDVCDQPFMDRMIGEFGPSHVFHLAWSFGGPPGGPSPTDPNVLAARTLFSAVGRWGEEEPWILLASSSAVYGAPVRQPISEKAPLLPKTPYGESKVATEREVKLALDQGRNVVTARTFNLIGPGVPSRLLPGSLASQVVAAEHGGPRTLRLGRLDSSRDYIDVRDAVRAYLDMALAPTLGYRVFNVCGGVATSGAELVDEFRAASRVPLDVSVDQTRIQAGDVDTQQGTAARLEDEIGWKPVIRLPESVGSLLEFQRSMASS